VPKSGFVRELPFSEKTRLNLTQKLAIAREVVRRLKPGASVYLDTGTTAVQVARSVPAGLPLRVFTNNLSVAMELFGRPSIEVVVYGGRLAARSPDLVGEFALSRIDDFRLDVAVIGADALDAARGAFYSADAATAMLSRLVQKQVRRTFVVADSSKFGRSSLARAGKLGPGTTLFTDDHASRNHRAAVRKTGARIVCVKCSKAKTKKAGSDRSVRSVRSRRKEQRHGQVRSKKIRR
jgi:DeoR family glycerol-3-phosphate regulon repressor